MAGQARPTFQEHPVASTEPEQPLDPAGQTPSVGPSIAPSTPHRQKAGVSAGQARRTGGAAAPTTLK